jgi:uncharacterized membrane protein YeaQ/YmgE (transglycosylase-associated protein family)
MAVRHPSYCSKCGAALTEKCPICQFQHPIGTKFCAADGSSIQVFVSEQNAWRRLLQEMHATLTVRPAKTAIACVTCTLPVLYFVGGFVGRWLIQYWQTSHEVVSVIEGGIIGLAFTALISACVVMILLNIVAEIEDDRRECLFRERGFTIRKVLIRSDT